MIMILLDFELYNLLQMSKTTTTLNPVLGDSTHDVEFQSTQTLIKKEIPLFPASTWIKEQFKRALSPEENDFLPARTLKYLIIQRAFLNQDLILLMSLGPFLTNPPEIEGLDALLFFEMLFAIKVISGVIFIICSLMLAREQKKAGIARLVSIEMFDHLKLSNTWLVIAGVLMLLNTLLDILVLCLLRCSASECNFVKSSHADSISVLKFQYSLIINLLLVLFFPFIYWKMLVFSRCSPFQ